ncbi:MAG: NUDIX domain-containing protein [Acidobacteria bacterium]|nr:NUDIX domain-containing protein [Acidobacteriota bacterium]
MGRSYPERPIVGVAAVLLDAERVLLVRRGQPPQAGLWSLPGGALEVGETIADGLRREILEETGLEARVGPLVEVFERILPDESGAVEYHYVLLDYLCEAVGGVLFAGDDAAAAAWFDRHSLGEIEMTPGSPAVIEKAFQLRSAAAPRP